MLAEASNSVTHRIDADTQRLLHRANRGVHHTTVTREQEEAEYGAARPRSGPQGFSLRNWFGTEVHNSGYSKDHPSHRVAAPGSSHC